jgi:hypothetical protein
LESLPESLRKFIHAVENPEDPSISSVFRKFLETDPKLLDGLHDGKFNGIHRAADCLEEKIVFNNRISHLSKLGFGLGILKKAIKKFENQPVTIESIRGFYLRSLHEQIIYSIICHYQVDEENKVVRLLGHQYRTIGAMKHDLAKNINRTVLIKSFLKKHLIEIDHLNYEMPTVQECLELGEIYIPRRGRLNQLIRREIRAYLKQR